MDLGKFFLERLRDGAKLAVALIDIKTKAAFFLRRLNGTVPFGLPVWFGFSGAGNPHKTKQKQSDKEFAKPLHWKASSQPGAIDRVPQLSSDCFCTFCALCGQISE